MTRKHFEAIAYALRTTHPRVRADLDIATDAYYDRVLQWERDCLSIASTLAMFNGAFQRDKFLRAAGYHVRPCGALYSVTGR